MKLYRIWQTQNNGYDTYDSAIVAAHDADEARLIQPSEYVDGAWADTDDVHVELIGTAVKGTKAGVILASFNAG